jgi:hypothetical protein
MMRCQHEPISLFDPPHKGDEKAAIHHSLSGYTTRIEWVICARCGLTAYWGGHGFKRRVRWNYDDDEVLKTAERHNRLMNGIEFERGSI